MIFSLLRLPVGDNQTDNWSVSGATGNLVAPIDPETGVLGPGVGSRRNDWPFLFLTDIHPDTRNAISGYTLPLWSEVRALVLEGQEALAAVPTLGWDVAITEDGPLLVETNWGYGVETIQVALQRGVREDMEAIFRYCS